ncbi:hypothetical protein PV326_013472 [Microctonus aethiopoides]|nr:hypothetical protein PV326_013472 [Microctonus aethiopoides]
MIAGEKDSFGWKLNATDKNTRYQRRLYQGNALQSNLDLVQLLLSSSEPHFQSKDVFHLSAVNQNSSHHSFVNTGRAKRKREDGTATDIPPNKVKRNNNDENTYSADNSLNTSLDSITASVYNRRQLPKSARGKINNNSSQPPIIITLSEKHNLLTNQEAINKINTDAIYKCDGKQLSILATNKSAHDEIVKFLADLQVSFHTYARKNEIKPEIILKTLKNIVKWEKIFKNTEKHSVLQMPKARSP